MTSFVVAGVGSFLHADDSAPSPVRALDSDSKAVDEIAAIVAKSVKEKQTLLVWVVDNSGSRFANKNVIALTDRFYKNETLTAELKRHESKRLLSSVFSVGAKVSHLLKTPTNRATEIKNVIAEILRDSSGVENLFEGVHESAKLGQTFQRDDKKTRRTVVVVLTDEVGDDQQHLEETIAACRRGDITVHVVGTPAPFGRKTVRVKWVDPDPNFDQTPQWAELEQGPESYPSTRNEIVCTRRWSRKMTAKSCEKTCSPVFAAIRLIVDRISAG